MPNLSDIRRAVSESRADEFRRKYLGEFHKLVNRDVILYATYFSQPKSNIPGSLLSIHDQDIQHLMSVISELRRAQRKRSNKLDIILHSPGGSLATTEQIVCYLRKQYKHIRVIVPQNAMSAATMLACAADEIIMGHHSALGPTDPQVFGEGRYISAHSIINEFNKAKDEVKEDMSTLPLWNVRIAKWPPGLLDDCARTIKLSEEIVANWLHQYMGMSKSDAENAAKELADANSHKVHNRPLTFDRIKSLGINVKLLEDDQNLQEAALSVFHATTVTFESTNCVKIIENDLGMGVHQLIRPSAN